ncbi:MAG: peptidylprolyl isomerase [Actinobacteria bacterium]|nr:peptidylprolyl isomerase [Actinomycetota bacterium]MCA1719909.1 peptidylprolyl isomerase [Actinomycetota bacterium]
MASSKREKELARMRAERQAARRAAAAARRRQRNAVIASVVAVALVALGVILLATKIDRGGDAKAIEPSAAASASPQKSLEPGTCEYTKTKQPASREVLFPPLTGVETEKLYTVHLTTNLGVIDIDLNTPAAPCTVNNFRSLTARHYYDNTPCHRLSTAGIFVVQCGDPTGQGTGGPGYTFADENLKDAKYPRGTVAMANSGPGSNGSQFFLVFKDTQLDPLYTPFGTITKGLDILEKVAKGGSTPEGDGKPNTPLKIVKATANEKKKA